MSISLYNYSVYFNKFQAIQNNLLKKVCFCFLLQKKENYNK